jgi:DNA polymerase (family 10)
MKIFTHMPEVSQIIAKGPTKSSVVLKGGIQVDIRVVDEDSYGSALAYFTGSKAHNIRLREIASKAGLKINEHYEGKDGETRQIRGGYLSISGFSMCPQVAGRHRRDRGNDCRKNPISSNAQI